MNTKTSEVNNESRISDIMRKSCADFISRDKKALEELFIDDFTFHSPHDPHIGKSAYFKKRWPNGDNFHTFEILDTRGYANEKLFVKGTEAFVRYECETKAGSKFRNTEYVRIKGDKIDRVEVYYASLPKEI
jgi:ketosteroid isomerase-like protein